jgi:tetratricopeptide (TPR) repeat protein
MNNLGIIYMDDDKYGEAEPLFLRTLEIDRRVLGEEHLSTLIVTANLARVYRLEGKYGEAESLSLKALGIASRVLGEKHQATIFLTNGLGWLYYVEGKYERAQALFSKALDAGKRGPEEHPQTLDSEIGVADIYLKQGKYAAAEQLYSRVLEIQRRALGSASLYTVTTLTSLGEVRLAQRSYPEAEATLREGLKVYETYWPDRWQRYQCTNLLGASIAGQKKFEEAEPLLVSGYEGMLERRARMSPAEFSSLKKAGDRIIGMYQEWGRPQKAAEWRQKNGSAAVASTTTH